MQYTHLNLLEFVFRISTINNTEANMKTCIVNILYELPLLTCTFFLVIVLH